MKKIWNVWKGIAEKIGNFQATVVFSLLYFLLITPVGTVFRLSKILKKDIPSWKTIEDNTDSFEKMKLQ